jgi:hypothetical protein
MRNNKSDGIFCYTVSEMGVIEAFIAVADRPATDCTRQYYTAHAAVALAIKRAEAFLKRDVSVTVTNRVRKNLGRLKNDPKSVLKSAHNDAHERRR